MSLDEKTDYLLQEEDKKELNPKHEKKKSMFKKLFEGKK